MPATSKIIPTIGPSLQALLGFIAISNAQQGSEVFSQLLLHCLVVFPAELSPNVENCCSTLLTLFGIKVSAQRTQSALDELIAKGQITRLPQQGANYGVNANVRSRVESRIEAARFLQERVKRNWLTQCQPKFPMLDQEQAWLCLQQYLAKLFRRHGLQTVQLLDARSAVDEDNSSLLKVSLDDALTDSCDEEQRTAVEGSLRLFVSTVGTDPDRTNFIVQLADGAFSYYSLSAPPEVAARLRSKLKELTLFLDTNFLFGLLGLHVNPFDAVSEELIAAIVQHHLPFTLRYHEATLTEMRRTIIAITGSLKGQHWPQALSRAAAKAPYVSSIERKFHEINSIQTVDPEVFFEPYEHPDVLLKDHGILIFRQPIDRLEERADLINHYQEFLKTRRREKPYEAIDHDMTVLDCVRHQRSKAPSSLDAKALIITCDTILSRFDWQELRSSKEMACTVLPNQFLQLLRPFVPASPEFDRSFAESFAIAEFRTIGASAEASSRLLSLLATYKDIKEETAFSLLANELLLDKLKKSKDDRQFKEFVDAALAAENAMLLEEMVALKRQAEREKAAQTQKAIEEQRIRQQIEKDRDAFAESHKEASQKVAELTSQLQSQQNESASSLRQAQALATTAEQKVNRYEARLNLISGASAFFLSAGTIGVFEYAIHYFKWVWLLSHPNSYALQAVIDLSICSFFGGLFRKPWRQYLWWGSVGFVALLLPTLGLLGGPPGH